MKSAGIFKPFFIAAIIISSLAGYTQAAPLVISAQDGKFRRVNGATTIPSPLQPDSLAIIDPRLPTPHIMASLDKGFEQSIAGPPQSIAISPDGRLIIAGAASILKEGKVVEGHYLQVLQFANNRLQPIKKIQLDTTVNGVTFSPDGKTAIAAGLDGKAYLFKIAGTEVSLTGQIPLSSGRLAAVQVTPDGKWALVSRRDEGGISVLALKDGIVSNSGLVLSSGLAPYTIGISKHSHWAAISNVGTPGLKKFKANSSSADASTITLYDLSRFPFKAVDFITTPAIPEGLSISDDGQWVAVQAMKGSFLPKEQAGYTPNGTIILYRNNQGKLTKTSEMPGSVAGQGLIFSDHDQVLLVQQNVENQIAVLEKNGGHLRDTGKRIKFTAGPVSIAAP